MIKKTQSCCLFIASKHWYDLLPAIGNCWSWVQKQIDLLSVHCMYRTDLFYLESTESDFTLFSLDWLHFQKNKNNNKTTQQQKNQPLRAQHPAQIIGLSWSSWHIIYTWRIGISQQCSSNQYFHWGCDLKMLGFYLYTHILPSFLLPMLIKMTVLFRA